jgi:hypothetical protein
MWFKVFGYRPPPELGIYKAGKPPLGQMECDVKAYFAEQSQRHK